ncbi:MAG: hypothetical protein QF578_16195 [Alphaproteobacteria bacterium]|jgi:hypothetical protein|nr:hypothetical protein [Alphaproteobacteria bacterium]MDP6566370.1 hypothetical protein [Alphaproteobacteria bacterium]MDP6814755.1 hypothetical protein [Alphaproteobacteria bacterium]|tara:strand:- start:4 stop:759 length:756 start_codon:yes stop_codon:yes gene_type:complete
MKFVDDLVIADQTPTRREATLTREPPAATPPAPGSDLQAAVNVGSILSFVDGLDGREKDDVLFSTQLAQRGASGSFDRFSETRQWYGRYTEILENVGWVPEQLAFSEYREDQGELKMDAAAIKIIAAIASANQLAILQQTLTALEGLADENKQIELFDFHSAAQLSGNFQIGAVQKSPNGVLSVALGAFYFKSTDNQRKFLFFSWGDQSVNFWTGAQKMSLNRGYYDQVRDAVQAKLTGSFSDFVAGISLG